VSYTCSLKAQNYIIYNIFSRFPSTEGQNESTNWIYGVHGRRKSAVSYRSEPDFNPRTNGYTTLPPLQSTSGIASDLETNSGSFCMFYCIFTKSRHNFFIFHVHLINATLWIFLGEDKNCLQFCTRVQHIQATAVSDFFQAIFAPHSQKQKLYKLFPIQIENFPILGFKKLV